MDCEKKNSSSFQGWKISLIKIMPLFDYNDLEQLRQSDIKENTIRKTR